MFKKTKAQTICDKNRLILSLMSIASAISVAYVYPSIQTAANYHHAEFFQGAGSIYKARGYLGKAAIYFQKAINCVKNESYSESIVARNLWLLAETYRDLGQFSKAENMMKLAYEKARLAYGDKSRYTLDYRKKLESLSCKTFDSSL